MSREQLEWIHYESREGAKKVLTVGDSILWSSRSYVEQALPEGLALTTLTTAHGVNEEQFLKTVLTLALLNDGGYEAVYFNNGLHPRGQSSEDYEKNYEAVLKAMMAAIPAKRWILGLSTPISNLSTESWDNSAPITDTAKRSLQEKNELVIAYNEKVRGIAQRLGLPCFDAYSLMEDKNQWKVDPYHYNAEGKRFFGEAVGAYLQKVMEE